MAKDENPSYLHLIFLSSRIRVFILDPPHSLSLSNGQCELQVVEEAAMDPSGLNLQGNPAENQESWTSGVSVGRGTPNLGVGTAVAGRSCPPSTLFPGSSLSSTALLNAMHEGSFPQAALVAGSGSSADEQHGGPPVRPSYNLPAGCTQVPISILVFHRRLTGRGSRRRSFMPAPALSGVSEDGAYGPIPQSDFLSLGGPSEVFAGDLAMNHSEPATSYGYNSEHAPMLLQPNGLYTEASNTESEREASQLQQSAEAVICDSHSKLESVMEKIQGQNPQESIGLVAEGSTDDNIHKYHQKAKRARTQITHSDKMDLPTQAVSACKEKTLTQIEMQIADAERTEAFKSEDAPAQKLKTRRRKHRPKVEHGQELHMENSPEGLFFGINSKLNKILDEYIHLPEAAPKPSEEIPLATSGHVSEVLARKQDDVRHIHDHNERSGLITTKRNKKDLDLNYSNTNGFQMYCSASLLPEMDSTKGRMTKVSKMDKNQKRHYGGESSLAGTQSSIIMRTAAEMLAVYQACGIKKKRSARVRRNSFLSVMDLEKNTSQESTRLPRSCMEALYESSYIKFMTKKRSQKARLNSPNSIQPNIDQKNRFSSETIFSGGFNGLKRSEETFQKTLPQIPDDKRINLDIHCKVPVESSPNTSTPPYMDYLQGVTSKFRYFDLNTEQVHKTEMHLYQTMPSLSSLGATNYLPNALVPYVGGAVVPYQTQFHLVKKQRPRAKVDLDFETTRVWNLLMGKAADPVDGTDVDKERWWKQEREVFQGRANSFIARMRLVQGDRRFSPWKGSVVDSVVGVFLTQNVADHLSSSAYMALAASFPPGSDSNCNDGIAGQDNEEIISTSAVRDRGTFEFFYNGSRPDIGLNFEELSMACEKIHMEPKGNATVNELTKGENYSLHCKEPAGSLCDHETRIDHKAKSISDISLVELTARMKNLHATQFQTEISLSQSVVTSESILQPGLPLSSGMDHAPRNFVGGISDTASQQMNGNMIAGTNVSSALASTELPVKLLHCCKRSCYEASEFQDHESLYATGGAIPETATKADDSTLKSGFASFNGLPDTAAQASKPKKPRTTSKKNSENFDWDKLRRQACGNYQMKERIFDRRDSVDWEAVRCADVQRISHAIRERGMNNVLAERIQKFLNRLVTDHGSIDLEWLRDVPPDSAKDYLLSIRGLGLKSVECVRLLTLHHLAFPVDTNVGRICVRLGWVPIQPLPESLQLHLLELYELHYQMITFGKVFCTKSKPNCNACPMRSECKHFASAFASIYNPDKSVPCRTAMRGSFPLNGTYFQVNEVFADHSSSHNPINIPREQLWNLHRRMVYFGTSVPTIFKGLTTEEIQHCFWRGFVCVRGFDMETRAPRPLCPHFHLAASKLRRSSKTAATEQTH
uniref:HhH-GPD domain-containing protein n=1 Tax=Oryza rufipogon TaxID=4529 RepID=A0A0E0PN78_ORYRU